MSAPRVSLVVISHNMARELPRTLVSLVPPYQRNCDGDSIEIIVVDNGSDVAPSADVFDGLDARFSLLRQPEATVSPVAAVNAGLRAATGPLIGVWIDGARLASPGLIDACLRASRLHPRPVLATLNYQLGSSLQYDSARHGYDQAAEDRLLSGIDWPHDGYRLFDIATSEMRGGPAGPMLESNALFLPKAMWDELEGYDAVFVEPGGGAANIDTFLRACALPGAQLIRILGEGTFHQFHGGVSTSTPESARAALHLGSRNYLRRRGRPIRVTRETGWLFDARSDRLVSVP